MTLRIAIVANDIGPVGGMERQLTSLVEGLSDRGHAVTVYARSCDLPRNLDATVRFVRIIAPRRPFAFAHLWFILAASLTLRRARHDVVQATGLITARRVDVVALHLLHAGAWEAKLPPRYSRNTLFHRLNARVNPWIARISERVLLRPSRVRTVVCVSRGLERELQRHYPAMAGRSSTIANGFSVERFARLSRPGESLHRKGARAVFVGSEWRAKGLAETIRALAAAPGWELVVVGAGDVDSFSALAAEAGVHDRVQFLGRQPDVSRHLEDADAFVLPSAYETFSLAAYEAAAAGLPLVCTRVSGIEEILEDGVTGFLCTRDSESIASGLRRLERPERRAAMGAEARKRAARFSSHQMVDRYEQLYFSLTSS
jgi:glycosyltransferase involved in cell wall biosynthesis